MNSISQIRALIEDRIPGSLTPYERSPGQTIPAGIDVLDHTIAGIEQGVLTQICASPDMSLGKATLLASLLAKQTERQECCALIDASDSFDPSSAELAGVDLSRLLWVRCGKGMGAKPLEQAFKAADIILQNGGFGLVALDLQSIDEKLLRRVPLTTWFRFARVVERMPAALLVFNNYPAAKSCAGVTIRLSHSQDQWSRASQLPHARILSYVSSTVDIERARGRKPVQGTGRKFTANLKWA